MAEQPQAPLPNKGYSDSAVSDAAEVGKTLIGNMTPADKGWILGFICVVFIIVASDMWVSIKTLESNKSQSQALAQYFIEIEQNRAQALERQAQMFADQVRRNQEVIRDLAHAVARDSERAGLAAMQAIDRKSYTEAERPSPDFIGPMQE